MTILLRSSELPDPIAAEYLSVNEIRITFRAHGPNGELEITTRTISLNDMRPTPHEPIGDVVGWKVDPQTGVTVKLRETISEEGPNGTKKCYVELWDGTTLNARSDVTDLHGPFQTDGDMVPVDFISESSGNYFIYTAQKRLVDDPMGVVFRAQWQPNDGKITIDALQGRLAGIDVGHSVFADVDRILVPVYDSSSAGRSANMWLVRPSNLTGWLKLAQPFGFDQRSGVVPVQDQSWRFFALLMTSSPDGGGGVLPIQQSGLSVSSASVSQGPAVSSAQTAFSTRTVVPFARSASFEAGRISERSCSDPAVVWLSHLDSDGANSLFTALHTFDIANETLSTVNISIKGGGPFPGLHVDSLPRDPFLFLGADNEPHVVLHSVWDARTTLLLISLNSGVATNLTPAEDQGSGRFSWNVLRVHADLRHIIAVRRIPQESNVEVVLGHVSEDGEVGEWTTLMGPKISNAYA